MWRLCESSTTRSSLREVEAGMMPLDYSNPVLRLAVIKALAKYLAPYIDGNAVNLKERRETRDLPFNVCPKGRHTHRRIKKATGKPITALYSKEVGPLNQPIATITPDPSELDRILRQAWQKVYNGNSTDHANTTTGFLNGF